MANRITTGDGAEDQGDENRKALTRRPSMGRRFACQAVFMLAHVGLIELEGKPSRVVGPKVLHPIEQVCSQRKRVMRAARSRIFADQRRLRSRSIMPRRKEIPRG